MQTSTLLWAAGLGACAPALALAQPAEPIRPAAQLSYSSAFADYKPFQELAHGHWRALNDAVGAAAAKPGRPATPPGQAAPAAATPTEPKAGMPRHGMKPMRGRTPPMRGSKS